MSAVVRPFTAADRPAAHDLRQQAFRPRRAPWRPDPEPYVPDDRRLTLEADGELVGTAGVWELGQWFGGRRVPMGGVAGVAVRPDHRGRGGATALLRGLLALLREHGDLISTLYPATVPLYRRRGWELGGRWPRRSVRARSLLGLPRADPAVRLRPATGDDVDALSRLHESLARHEPGQLSRSPSFASRLLSPPQDAATYAYTAERDGAVVGHVRYAHESTADDRAAYDLRVHQLFGADAAAELALWRLVASSASEADTVRYVAPPVDPLALWLPELETRAEPFTWHWMTRLVDAPGAIAARGYPPGLEASVHLDVTDPDVPEHAGPHVLTVADGHGALEPGGRGSVRLDVGALAAAYTGWADAHALARAGRIVGATTVELTTLSAVFASGTPWMRDYF